MLKTTDEALRELQSVQRAICQRDATSKSGNDMDVMQSHKPSQQQVSYSIRIGHIYLQQHFIASS